ncbi:MAG: type I-D CRISPR-associated helicase Cas3', partial [Cyanobacteriota bacterium]|nr:type I-D CRISPR-associated helicase Cas3' [Cyanobacteriota bacterium]
FEPKQKPRVNRLSSAELEIYAENDNLKKSAAIATRSGQSEVLLTNPDIFHYLHQGSYLMPKDSPDKLWGRIDKNFDVVILDEFHVFSAPQISNVINTMLLIKNTNRNKKFLFLSATPESQLIEKLTLAGFRIKQINPLEENKYQFPNSIEESKSLESQGWRQILRETELNFISLESTTGASETWLRENRDRILDHFLKSPGTQGAIILNSIAAVKRLVPFFSELFAAKGLTVGENTGLSGKAEKMRSLAADLVLGTSTIDVGVDFKINLLIFESADAGNFIQRLGRLGRHNGYKRNGEEIKFQQFTAYALIPKFLVERLFSGDDSPLEANQIYDRCFFYDQIREKYRQINDFRGYYQKWGAFQSVMLCWKLGHKTIQQQYRESQQQFKLDCQQVFQTSLGGVAGRIKALGEEWRENFNRKTGNPIVDEATSFRGSSALQCGLYDLTESNQVDRFKTYDLPGILSNLEIEAMTEVAFKKLRQDTVNRTETPIPKGRFEYCLGFMKLLRYREERLNWKFIYSGDLQAVADSWRVQVLKGIEVWQPENYWISEINKRLRRKALVCYVLRFPVAEVRMRLRLPMHFQIYPISDRYSIHGSTPYAIAFGQSALLIDTLASWLESQGGEIWMS